MRTMNCPDCGAKMKPHIVKKDRKGRYTRYWECTNPNCKVTKITQRGKIERAAA